MRKLIAFIRVVLPALVYILTICTFLLVERELLGPPKGTIPGHAVSWAPWAEPRNIVPWSMMPSPNETSIAYIIMTSLVTRDLHLSQRRTFLRNAKHVWAFSDVDDGIFTTTLPELEGKGTWQDAQHRQLRGMQSLHLPLEITWIFMIDDDTWVNTPVLHRFISLLPRDPVMMCGHVTINNMNNGGAGMLISRRLYDIIVPKFYTEECPFLGVNDDTVTSCARKTPNVTLMHSSAFQFYPKSIDYANQFIDQITIHPVKDPELMQAMTATVNEFYQY